jgi:hypothetical protein
MNKQAISVTLDAENLTWLRGRMTAIGARSISELLDQLVTSARRHGQGRPRRSVVGAIEIDSADPDLLTADAAVQSLFEESLRRTPLVHESSPAYSARPTRKRRRRA